MNPTAVNKRPIPQEHLDAVANMDISMFDQQDILNLILQRAQIMFDVHKGGQLIRAWVNGDPKPLQAQVEARPELLIRRALALLYAEFVQHLPVLRRISPTRIADIGCGYGFFDVFAAREFGCSILLIDLEESENRNFGYKMKGAAYSNLERAKEFALANGIAKSNVATCNPKVQELAEFAAVDLAVSFLSCGFHYPVNTYDTYFRDGVVEDGHLMLDLMLRRRDEQVEVLSKLGAVSSLALNEHRECMLVTKGG